MAKPPSDPTGLPYFFAAAFEVVAAINLSAQAIKCREVAVEEEGVAAVVAVTLQWP